MYCNGKNTSFDDRISIMEIEVQVSSSSLKKRNNELVMSIISVNESYAGNCSKKGEAVTDDLDTTSKDVEADPNLAKKRKFMNHRNPMGSQCEFDVRTAFYKDFKKFQLFQAQIVSDLGEEVKKEFRWIWESVENENESVKLVFYGRKNKVMYDDDVLLGEVFDDCEGDLDAIMIVSLAGNEVEDEGDVYHQFSVFRT
ncbi:unnamed protein product [Trifolium pratense]|uniref:Uncharacterized protein n=1 Tax=Trifolium pratense TaxID=57577 RepID=A0ACB0I7I0_TRIPR|nr:unnamed protein product [Trifolium pratense]